MKKKRVLIQCGDVDENITRILPLMETYRSYGWQPIALQNTSLNKNRFLERGFDRIALNWYKDKASFNYKKSFLCSRLNPEVCYSYDVRKLARSVRTPDTARIEKRYIDQIYNAWRMLDEIKPERLIVWNGWTGTLANCLHTIKQIKGIKGGFLERGLFADTLFYDEAGVNGHSILAQGVENSYSRIQIAAARCYFDPVIDEHFDFDLIERNSARKNKTIFLPLQVQDDSNCILHSKHLINMKDTVLRALELAKALGEEWKVQVREHPEEDPNAILDIPIDERIYFDSQSDLDQQIDDAGIVYTVNSSVGLKAAIRGAPVVVGGDGVYCAEPFVVRDEMGSVNQVLAGIDKWKSYSSETKGNYLRDFLSVFLGYHQATDRWRSLNEGFFNLSKAKEPASEHPLTPKQLDLPSKIKAITKMARVDGQINVDLYMDFGAKRIMTYRITKQVTMEDMVQIIKQKLGDDLQVNIRDGNHVYDIFRNKVGIFVGKHKSNKKLWNEYYLPLDEFGALISWHKIDFILGSIYNSRIR